MSCADSSSYMLTASSPTMYYPHSHSHPSGHHPHQMHPTSMTTEQWAAAMVNGGPSVQPFGMPLGAPFSMANGVGPLLHVPACQPNLQSDQMLNENIMAAAVSYAVHNVPSTTTGWPQLATQTITSPGQPLQIPTSYSPPPTQRISPGNNQQSSQQQSSSQQLQQYKWMQVKRQISKTPNMASESDIVVKTTYRNKTRDAVSSPVKSEAVATIETSVLEEVYLNNESNGTAHESKQALDDEAQPSTSGHGQAAGRKRKLPMTDESDVDEVDADQIVARKKRQKFAGAVCISAGVTQFYKLLIDEQTPRTINGQERCARCVWCKEAYLVWSKGGYFMKPWVLRHLKICKNAKGLVNPASKQHQNFEAGGSCDLSILWPNLNDVPFFVARCGLCQELVHVSENKPKDKQAVQKSLSSHLLICPFIGEVRERFFGLKYKDEQLDPQFKDAAFYSHQDSIEDNRPLLYLFRSKAPIVHNLASFFNSIDYFGQTITPFVLRMTNHKRGGKDLSKVDTVPVIFCTAGGEQAKEDAKKLEAVAIWLFHGMVNFKNDERPVKPLEEMKPEEFESIAATLFVALHSFYVDYTRKNPPAKQLRKVQEAEFEKARNNYMQVLDEPSRQILNGNPALLLRPDALDKAALNPNIARLLSELSRELK